MKQNSYTEFIGIIRDEGSKNNPPTIQLGVVASINPIQILVGELPLFQDNLYINKQLLGYSETVLINGNSETIVHNSILTVNDTVFLYPVENNQKYIVLGVA